MAEELGKLRFRSPLRCLDCKTRFIAQTFKLSDLRYARCPVCHRMDLNGWTGKTYTDPPFRVSLKIAFGARRFRCEYCRLNFASFGRRKEVFSFKRWKKFGNQAEASPAAPQSAPLQAPPAEAPPPPKEPARPEGSSFAKGAGSS